MPWVDSIRAHQEEMRVYVSHESATAWTRTLTPGAVSMTIKSRGAFYVNCMKYVLISFFQCFLRKAELKSVFL